jgi:opacity protein-like surface antigen
LDAAVDLSPTFMGVNYVLGASYKIMDNLTASAEYNVINGTHKGVTYNLSTLGLGVNYRF